MALFDIYLEVTDDYLKTIQDIYKYFVILVVFQVLVHYAYPNKNVLQTALSGSPANDEFMCLVIFLLIGVVAYHLVAEKIIKFY